MSRTPPAPPPTYAIADDRRSILCLRCGLRSHHLEDVRHIYCGKCGYHAISRDDTEHGDPRMLVGALMRRALHKAKFHRLSIPGAVIEQLEAALETIDATLAFEALGGMEAGS